MKKITYIPFLIVCMLMHLVLQSQTPCPEGQRQNGFGPPVREWSPPEFDPPVNVASGGGISFQDTNRIVFFVHGLGGTPMSWTKARDVTEEGDAGFPARKVMAHTLDYSNQVGSLSQAASDVYSQVKYNTVQQDTDVRKKNYIIAHSQGGMVSRAVDQRYEQFGHAFNKDFGGIVTMGTPHQGAYIGNSMRDLLPSGNTRVEEWIEDGCNKLTSAFLSISLQEIKISFKILWFINKEIKIGDHIDPNVLSNAFCGYSNDILNILPDFKAMKAPILDDYKLGASRLQDLGNFDATSQNPPHKIAFYGIKDKADQQGNPQSIFFRTAQWFIVSPNELPYFSANEDGQVETVVNDWINKFENEGAKSWEKAKEAKGEWLKWKWAGVFAQKHWNNYAKYNNFSKNLNSGAKWLREVDRTWAPLIGAETYEEVIETGCYCRWWKDGTRLTEWEWAGIDYGFGCDIYEDQGDAGLIRICEVIPMQVLQIKQLPSDGVVLAESAANYPGTTEITRKKMTNTSHMQMRNNKELKDGLNALYDGNIKMFFRLDPK